MADVAIPREHLEERLHATSTRSEEESPRRISKLRPGAVEMPNYLCLSVVPLPLHTLLFSLPHTEASVDQRE